MFSHAPLFTTVASFHRAESRQELLLIFSCFKRCSTWDPVNSNSRSCVTKQLVASNHRKHGRYHVAKRFLRCTTNTWLVTFHSTSKEVKFYALKGLFFNLFPFHLIIFLLFKIWDVIITVIFIVIIAMIMNNSTPSTTIIRCCSIHFKV